MLRPEYGSFERQLLYLSLENVFLLREKLRDAEAAGLYLLWFRNLPPGDFLKSENYNPCKCESIEAMYFAIVHDSYTLTPRVDLNAA